MKYTDIIQSVERQILDGLLKPGKLPSIRALTESYSCSKIQPYGPMLNWKRDILSMLFPRVVTMSWRVEVT